MRKRVGILGGSAMLAEGCGGRGGRRLCSCLLVERCDLQLLIATAVCKTRGFRDLCLEADGLFSAWS